MVHTKVDWKAEMMAEMSALPKLVYLKVEMKAEWMVVRLAEQWDG